MKISFNFIFKNKNILHIFLGYENLVPAVAGFSEYTNTVLGYPCCIWQIVMLCIILIAHSSNTFGIVRRSRIRFFNLGDLLDHCHFLTFELLKMCAFFRFCHFWTWRSTFSTNIAVLILKSIEFPKYWTKHDTVSLIVYDI